MRFLSQQDELQVMLDRRASFYAQLAHGSLKTGSISSNDVILRHIKSIHDSSTQISNELGTTDIIIGDATAEIMITTLGKIPNEMYYLEDTTPSRKFTAYNNELNTTFDNNRTLLATIETVKYDGYTERSTLLIILLTTLLIILLICCVTACVIARSRGRQNFFAKSDVECSPGCGGVNQPLLDKVSNATTKTSASSMNN